MFEPTGFMNFVTKKSVSKCYLAIHSLLLMAIGAALIGFQIYGMLANVFTNAIYAGYWCGGIFLLFGLLAILSICVRRFSIYRLLIILYTIPLAAGVFAIAFSLWLSNLSSPPNWQTYTMIGLEGGGSLLSFFFLIAVPSCIGRGSRKYAEDYFNSSSSSRTNRIRPGNF